MRAVSRDEGQRKLRLGGKTMTAAEFNLRQIQGQAYMGSGGKPKLGEKGKDEKSEGAKYQIDLSPRASKYFDIKDVRNDQSAAGSAAMAQWDYAANTGKVRMNDKPILGGG